MCVVSMAERAEPWAPRDYSCFYCGERLAVNLLGDVREGVLSGATGERHWVTRCARALRTGLVAQEGRT